MICLHLRDGKPILTLEAQWKRCKFPEFTSGRLKRFSSVMIRTVEKLEGRADFEQIIVMKDQGGGVSLSAPPTRKHVVRRPPKAKALFLC